MTQSRASDRPIVAARQGGRLRRRTVAIGVAVAAALVVYLVERLLGVHVQTPGNGGAPPADLGPVNVLLTALVACLLGWALLAVLERLTSRARTIWTVIAVLFSLLSLAAPLLSPGLSTAQRIALAFMHVSVAVILIPLFTSTVRPRAATA
jgi:hypothetical protein